MTGNWNDLKYLLIFAFMLIFLDSLIYHYAAI